MGSALAELTLHSSPRPLLSQQDMLPVAWQVTHAPVLHAIAVEHPAAPMAVQGVHEHLQAARSWNSGTEILHSRLHSGPVVELAQNVKTGAIPESNIHKFKFQLCHFPSWNPEQIAYLVYEMPASQVFSLRRGAHSRPSVQWHFLSLSLITVLSPIPSGTWDSQDSVR